MMDKFDKTYNKLTSDFYGKERENKLVSKFRWNKSKTRLCLVRHRRNVKPVDSLFNMKDE